MDNAAKMRVAIAGVVVLILIGVVAGVVNHVQRDDELPPIHRPTPISTTPLVPLLDRIDGYIFNIDGGIRVYVCKEEYVYLRRRSSSIRCNTEQWHKFTLMFDAIEYSMGINRVDEGMWIAPNKTETIKFCEKKECITLTLDQWFQLRKLAGKINNVLGVKDNTAEQPYITSR